MSQQQTEQPEQVAPVEETGVPPPIMATPTTTAPNPLEAMMLQAKQGSNFLEKRILEMQASLDRRTKLPFDPALMQLAAGLLAPTRTGRFGESLGMGMQAYNEETKNQLIQQQKDEALKLELAQKMLEQQQYASGMQLLGQMMPTGGQQAAPAVSQAVPAGAVPQGGMMTQPAQGMPDVTDQMLLASNFVDPKTRQSIQDLYAIKQKRQEQEYKQQELAIKGQGVERTIPGIGVVKMSINDVNAYDLARNKASAGDTQPLQKWFTDRGYATEKLFSQNTFNPPSSGQLAASDEGLKVNAAEQAKANNERGLTLFTRPGDTANTRINIAKNIYALAESNPAVFNTLKGMGFMDSIARVVKTGITSPWGSIGFDATPLFQQGIDKSGRKYTPEDYSALQMAAQNYAELQIAASQLAKGLGSISDFERQIFARIGISSEDNAQTMKWKSEALQTRALFDEKAAELWAQYRDTTGKSPDSFKATPEYKQLVAQYNDNLEQFRQRNSIALAGSPSMPSGASGKSLKERMELTAKNRGLTQ